MHLGIQDYSSLKCSIRKRRRYFLAAGAHGYFSDRTINRLPSELARGLGIVEATPRRKITSSGQIHDEKDRYQLLSLDELLNLNATKLIAFTPKTRPVLKKALSWQDYTNETDETDYAPPKRSLLQVDEQLTRRDRPKDATLKKKPAERAEAASEPVKLAPLPPKVASNLLLWSKEIRIEWAPGTGYQPNTYSRTARSRILNC